MGSLNRSARRGWLGVSVVAAAMLGASPAAAATMTRGPYLQQVTETGALVVWRTAAAAACTLTATAVGESRVTVITPAATQHVATLTGLAPATRYDYAIQSAGTLAGGSDCFFHTAPTPGSGATVRFLMFGDSGTGNATQAAVAAQIVAQTVHFGLHLGDIIYPGGESQYYDPRYFTPYASFLRHTPMWAAIGNHDEVTPSSFLAAWYLPTNPVNGSERFYSFDYGDLHMVALDTTDPFTTAMLNWLRSDLDATTRRWKIVFFHHTMYSCGNYHGSSGSLISTLAPIFESHGVDLVFYGHDHHYERSYPMRAGQRVGAEQDPDYVLPDAPMYIISGTGGATRSSSTSCLHTARAVSTPSFVRFEVTGSDLAMEAVAADGRVFDRMTLSKDGQAPPPPPPVQTAQVVAPNGGEAVTVTSSLDLRWTASSTVASVRIELSRTSVDGPWETLFASTPNDGHEAWTVTGPPSPTCWLRVFDSADGTPSDLSNTAFAIVSAPEPPPGAAVVRVNFQPGGTPAAAGYVADTGAPFDAGRGFGWNTTQVVVARNTLPGDPRDTFVDVVNTATAVWEAVVPNGGYRVSLTCGDLQTSATHRVALEGQRVIDDVYTIGGSFAQHADLPVQVADGRLTLVAGGSGALTHTKVNAIVVVPATSGPTPYAIEAWNSGETRCIGLASTISWSGGGAAAPLRLELSRSGPGGPWETAIGIMMDDGSETWAPSGPPAAACWLRLVDASGGVLDVSDVPFALQAPSMRVLAPNGGETWTAGMQHTFAWTSSCFAGDVRIEVSRDGAAGPWTTLVGATPNDGAETWTVREQDVGWTHVRVAALPFLMPGDQSDAAFTVASGALPLPIWSIDFTVPDAAPAQDMKSDAGLPFDAARGFGWDRPVMTRQRDLMPGDCRDTFAQVVNDEIARWELQVPNGEYRVSLVCGDAFTSGTHRVALEDRIVVDDVYSIGGVFVNRDEAVTVNDGRLTMTLGGSGTITSTKVTCLTLRAMPAVTRLSRRARPHEIVPVEKSSVTTRLEMPAGPVRDGADLELSLALGGRVRLALHDVRGRRVALLLDGPLPAGRHDLRWQTVDDQRVPLASGVYFLQLDAPDRRESRKLVLVR